MEVIPETLRASEKPERRGASETPEMRAPVMPELELKVRLNGSEFGMSIKVGTGPSEMGKDGPKASEDREPMIRFC